MIHDRLCHQAGHEVIGEGCWSCDYIQAGRLDAAATILSSIEAEFPRPTLGIQKVIRLLKEMTA